MWNAVIRWSLDNRVAVLGLATLLLVMGTWTAMDLPVDVLPDVNAPTVTVLTETHGMAPEEGELLVTVPIETALNGVPGLRRLRSSSGIGISIVWAEFEWDTDPYLARQLVAERLQIAQGSLPAHVPRPSLAPMSSIMGEILFLGVSGDAHPMDIRDFADWELRRRLLGISGVAQVTPIGGELRQVQIVLDPSAMERASIGHHQILAALQGAAENAPGGFITSGYSEYLVRGLGRAQTLDELGLIAVGRAGDAPVFLHQLAEIRMGAALSRGVGSVNAEPAVVLAVTKQPEANTLDLTSRIDTALDEVERSMPAGMTLHRDGFRQSRFIETAVTNVSRHLGESAVLIIVLLTLFLANWRTTVISLVALPLSLLAGALTLAALGTGFNTMTLGGLAIAIGALVDDAIIDVENVYRRLRLRAGLPEEERPPLLDTVYEASVEIRGSIVYATAIIVVVFAPLFFFSGLEGRLLQPLGTAYVASLVASLVVAVTVTPALCSVLLRSVPPASEESDSPLVRLLKKVYSPTLRFALGSPRAVLAVSLIGAVAAGVTLGNFGRSFLPTFNEGAFTVAAATAPGTPLAQSDAMVARLERAVVALPIVQSVTRRTGRAEKDEHAQDVQFSELEVTIRPGVDRADAAEALRKASAVPGVVVAVGQPIGHRIEHMLSGVKTSLALKVFGEDLGDLRRAAAEVEAAISGIDGLVDLSVEQQQEVPQVVVRPRYSPLALLGLTPGEVAEWVETALVGQVVGSWWRDGRAHDMVVRYPDEVRGSIEALASAPIDADGERFVSLSQVATVQRTLGPNLIQRENAKRRIVVMANVEGRDIRGVVDEIRAALPTDLPEGTYVVVGGQAESEAKATRTIVTLSAVAIVAMLGLLWVALGSGRDAILVMSNLPLALIGGVLVVTAGGGVLSVASLVGFITLFGIATRNGILLVTHYHHLIQKEGASLAEAVERGSEERLVPVLMTALGTALALTPIALAAGEPGNEIQAPMAAVILGGLASSTLLVLLVLPVLYIRYGRPNSSETPS
ncbi:MAG: efflux RND transporter permease subunit [Deltaproteobacteria bacterium]|nr:efflux RND transporter permease subunit [Deltaproteobacteria bacterium]